MAATWIGWHKSSRSSNSGAYCVEVGHTAGGTVGVRDTKDHGRGPILAFSGAQWNAFLRTVRAGHVTAYR